MADIATLTRHPERGSDARADLDAILDAGRVATVCAVVDGEPWVVPMLYGRYADRVVIHGSTGAGLLGAVASGAPVVVCVTHLDGLVYAESLFESSANYRSAVLRGRAETLSGEEKVAALDALADQVMPGRRGELHRHTAKELAATLVLALPIVEGSWTVKSRSGPPVVPEVESDTWRGVLPIHLVYGAPQAAPDVPPGTPVSPSVEALAGGSL